jgi:hypothetical protein
MTFRAERSSASQASLHAYAMMFNLGGNYPPLQTFQDRLAFRYGQPSGGGREQILALNCGDFRFRRPPTNAFGNQSYSPSHLTRLSLPTTLHALDPWFWASADSSTHPLDNADKCLIRRSGGLGRWLEIRVTGLSACQSASDSGKPASPHGDDNLGGANVSFCATAPSYTYWPWLTRPTS